MDSPSGSSLIISQPRNYKKLSLILTIILLILAVVLIIVSIVRNEQRVITLSADQSVMLRRICEATVSHC